MFEPYFDAPTHIQIHAAAATIALGIGPFALFSRRRGRVHKTLGYVWVVAMLIVATSAFFIHSFAVIGPFSPIHGFAILAYWSIWTAMRAIYQGRIEVHEQTMRGLYFNGLILAGLANFLPGRITNRTFFPQTPEYGYIVIAFGVVLVLFYWERRNRRMLKRAKTAPEV